MWGGWGRALIAVVVERGPQVLLTHISPSVSPLRSDFSPTSRATLIFHKPQAEGATRAQTIHITLMSTEEVPSVLDREFDSPSVPLLHFLHIAHSFILQMRLLPPNTCLIWAVRSRSSRSFIGSSRAGRDLKRN